MTTQTKKMPVILVIDDDPTNLRFLQEILKSDYKVFLSPSGKRALRFLESHRPDLILLDVEMPQMSGYDVITVLKANPVWRDIPIIFLTGLEGRDKEQYALDLGASDYILKPISTGIVKARVGLQIELEAYRKNLEEMVEVRTDQLRRTQDSLLDILASMTSYRDNETGSHIKRTTFYSKALVEHLQSNHYAGYEIDDDYAEAIIKSAKLHDIGKVAVPDNILLKPGKLTDEEFEMIKHHTVYGAQIVDTAINELSDTSFFLSVAREIIVAHHEKWNGRGYPLGIAGTDIPLSARIMAIADVYDALISDRPYKKAFSHEMAVSIIKKDAGTHFDPHLLEISSEVIDQFEEIARLHKDEPSDWEQVGRA